MNILTTVPNVIVSISIPCFTRLIELDVINGSENLNFNNSVSGRTLKNFIYRKYKAFVNEEIVANELDGDTSEILQFVLTLIKRFEEHKDIFSTRYTFACDKKYYRAPVNGLSQGMIIHLSELIASDEMYNQQLPVTGKNRKTTLLNLAFILMQILTINYHYEFK